MEVKHKIIIKYYSGKSQNDGVFYGNCTISVINRELNKTVNRINDSELLTALVIFPSTNQYFTLGNPKYKIMFDCGYMSDEEYKTFVLDRYFHSQICSN
ncbi:MAG: hypothetical protein IJH63_06155 [Methanobrevibacter sp.]|nr:hypothetical protein [Methanobrevibacter sp.]